MNEYRITDSAGITCNPITAVNEKEARKIFWATCKWAVGDITKIELIRENVPATKAQEREALEKIKAIVATLGPRSYVGTALDGCLVDAEVNIENDFGDSMKARWQDAEKRVAQVVQEAAEIRDKLQQEIREKQQAREEAKAAIREAERRADRAIKTAEDDANFYRDKVLDSDDLTDIAQLVDGKMDALRADIETAAARIIEGAEEPESDAFKNAVKYHRAVKGGLEYYQALAQRVKHARGQ